MASKKTHDVIATVSRYKVNGEEKKRVAYVGSAFMHEGDSRIWMKLDALPCSPTWSGWLSLYPVEERPPRGEGRPVRVMRDAPPVGEAGDEEVPE